MKKKVAIFLGLSLLLTACGFHLRGYSNVALDLPRVYVQSQGADELAAEIVQQLHYAGVSTTENADEAGLWVKVRQESFDQRVLAVSAQTGKVEEYQLGYKVNLLVAKPDGNVLINDQQIGVVKELTFSGFDALGKYNEAAVIRDDMRREVATTILRRLQAIQQLAAVDAK
ncbi:MAG: LPS assembly lipoprotein LptE [Gammaproteobacteria bacterium]|nr:LPS assembly lipoprotein LptE [Gammaproteobacteria bacterium]MCI0591455.1 LPS assembly lipoprotein LptE [Gammaproteobacteria bacterium]